MNKRYLIILMVVIALLSCNKTNKCEKTETLTPEKELIIQNEVKNVMSDIIKSVNTLNADSAFKYICKKNYVGFTDNGKSLRNHDSTLNMFKRIYSSLQKLDIKLIDDKYTALSPDIAIFTTSFEEEIVDKNNTLTKAKGAMTAVLKKSENQWRVIHVHQSYYNE